MMNLIEQQGKLAKGKIHRQDKLNLTLNELVIDDIITKIAQDYPETSEEESII